MHLLPSAYTHPIALTVVAHPWKHGHVVCAPLWSRLCPATRHADGALDFQTHDPALDRPRHRTYPAYAVLLAARVAHVEGAVGLAGDARFCAY